MMHTNRRWCVSVVESADALSHLLTERTWTLCSGFCIRGHEEFLFLNDSTSEDGAGEFAVVKGGVGAASHLQVESVTFSWCRPEEALKHIEDALAGRFD